MKLFKGSAVAIITPFQDGQIDIETFKQLVTWHVKEGTQALIVTGTTGESATLNHEEKLTLYRAALESAQGKVPVIANTGTNNTAESIHLSKAAEAIGVDGLLVVTPYYNKPNQAGMAAHFRAIAKSVTIPIILYNVPSRTGVNLEAKTLGELARNTNIVAIKEAAGDLEQVRAMIAKTPDDFALYSGNDDLYLETLRCGGDGVISVVANLEPAASQKLYTSYLEDDTAATRIQERLDILNDVLFIAPNPVPVKTALEHLGVPVGGTRLPLVGLDETENRQLLAALDAYGLKVISL